MKDQLNGFTLHVEQTKNARQNWQIGLIIGFLAGLALIITGTQLGIEGGAYIYCYSYGSALLWASIQLFFQYKGLQFVDYTDRGEFLQVQFGEWNTYNCMNNCCRGYCGGIGNADQLRYDTIENVEYEELTCHDGCGTNKNKAHDVIFSVGCCVPGVRVTTSEAQCCQSGVTKFGVQDRGQAEELITFLESKRPNNEVV